MITFEIDSSLRTTNKMVFRMKLMYKTVSRGSSLMIPMGCFIHYFLFLKNSHSKLYVNLKIINTRISSFISPRSHHGIFTTRSKLRIERRRREPIVSATTVDFRKFQHFIWFSGGRRHAGCYNCRVFVVFVVESTEVFRTQKLKLHQNQLF